MNKLIQNDYLPIGAFIKGFALSSTLLFSAGQLGSQEASRIVYKDEQSCLRYVADQEHNYIPDFSYAGYKNGETILPSIATVRTIAPVLGDNTQHIQAALDELAGLPMNEEGFRGALLLEAGAYEIHGTIVIRASGVVLRGMGNGSDTSSNTVLLGVGNAPEQRDIIQVGNAANASWSNAVAGTQSTVTSSFVPAGSRSLAVAAPELYSIGNNVIVKHRSTTDWLASINNGGTATDSPWSPGTIDIVYNRYITGINLEESKINLDAPIYDHLEQALSQSEIYVLDKSGIRTNIGIEDLRIDIQTAGSLDEAHARNGVRLIGVEDCWVRGVTALHFSYAAVETTLATRVTVLDCEGLQPHSLIDGGRRYNFVASRSSNNILFERCHASEGRHSFVSNGTSSVSGIVFYDCNSQRDYSASEGHRRWSQGLLFDNITFSQSQTNTLLGLYNRGSFGTGHGWSSVASVAWKVKVPLSRNIKLQKPPGRQNYAIACEALVTNLHTFPHPIGYVELSNQTPLISSLYREQFETRQEKGIAPDGPCRLEAVSTIEGVLLNWLDIASRETSYHIEVSKDGGSTFEEVVALPADATSFLDTTTNNFPDENRIYRVYAGGETCPSPFSNPAEIQPPNGPFWEEHWMANNYEFIGSGGSALTVIKTDCEEAFVQVTDPIGSPLAPFSPLIINPKDSDGEDITDISIFPLIIHMRARSAQEVVVGALLRSDDGTTDFRSSILYDTIAADLEQWTSISLEFSGEDIAGFNASNLRDVWLFLDRGTENFAGNELYIDYVSLGGKPTSDLESPCTLGEMESAPLFAEYFQESTFPAINTNSSAGQVTTFMLDSLCETLQLKVTDPLNDPLPAFNAYIINPIDESGADITNLENQVNLSMRVRSIESVQMDVLFRSGEGSQEERSVRKTITIPGDLEAWTNVSFPFSAEDYEGFDPTDLRDVWFYLDRGEENFSGNEAYIDHIVVGGEADSTKNSPCLLDNPAAALFAEYFQGDTLKSISTTSTAGLVTNFTIDTACETLQISVDDPVNAPLPPFNAYIVNPIDANGMDITNIVGQVNVSMRVRSAQTVQMDALFRSGGGSQDERSARKAVMIPGNLEEWTDVSLSFDPSDYEGFDPNDLRDFWFYLDRGTANFPGNELYIDHIIIGGSPNTSQYSPCDTDVQPQTWIENWTSENPTDLGGTETVKLTLTETDCEELKIEVSDPSMDPHTAFRPIVVNPRTPSGSEVTDISGNVQLILRVRSAEEVPIGVLFRSGDGSADFRTALLTQTVPKTLEAWTTLTYSFTAEDLGGFDPSDFTDFWIFLDRSNDNFPGNELYLDYVAIGQQPDTIANSPCGLPDFVVASDDVKEDSFFTIYPNPTSDHLNLKFDVDFHTEKESTICLFDVAGQLLLQKPWPRLQRKYTLDLSDLQKGTYFLEVSTHSKRLTKRIVKL